VLSLWQLFHAPGLSRIPTLLFKVVPDDALTAKVFISNQDIGFVKEGMNVDVRIDLLPW